MKRSTGNYESQLPTFSLQPPFIKQALRFVCIRRIGSW